MHLRGKSIPRLLDSGCQMTLVPKTVVDEANDISLALCDQRIWAANGTEVEIAGHANISFKLAGRDLSTNVLISPDIEDVILVWTG